MHLLGTFVKQIKYLSISYIKSILLNIIFVAIIKHKRRIKKKPIGIFYMFDRVRYIYCVWFVHGYQKYDQKKEYLFKK